ncbi:MAG: cytochrome c oxidase subunit 3 [Pseudomonadota bacterium]
MNTASAPAIAERGESDHAATFAVWIFLATELLLFGPLFFGYVYVRTHVPEAAGAASRHTNMLLGTVNTAVLLTSSLCMALAGRRARAKRGGWRWLGAAALLGMAFLAIKGIEYRQEFDEHLFPGRSFAPGDAGSPAHAHGMQLFFLLYFAMTALHALHLAIGCVLCLVLALATYRRHAKASGQDHALAVELVGLYWHFVDAVWIFLYPLLYLLGRAGG